MLAKTIGSIIENFDKACDDVVQNCEPMIITRSNGGNVVIMSQAEYDNLLENLYIRQSPANYDRLLKSIQEAKDGKLTSLEIGDPV